jgi:hypothetical protein
MRPNGFEPIATGSPEMDERSLHEGCARGKVLGCKGNNFALQLSPNRNTNNYRYNLAS